MSALLGTFEWGLVNGEGICGACGWPARMVHRFQVDGHEATLTFPMQYHPDELEVR
jgi:hypothetical protein